ncbi:hypothetical protein MNBD_GAMMA14-2098 [hydrothermal vent metagenome]|uniref:Thiocyanate hydrolase subunit beta n=1 Tax=hydrothermal vent metagenome TaxID=652676 RepID=A0A3B0Z942_9ZZZZ
MSEINPEKIRLDEEMASRNLDPSPIPLLERIKQEGRVWDDLSEEYGVDNPDPPWKVTLEATCDVLAEVSCTVPALERRWEEDELSEELYVDVPFPERQLLALAHTMIRRGLLDEEELASLMKKIDKRLHMT